MPLLVECDILVQKPEAAMRLICDWLGEPWLAHDVAALDDDEPEFDRQLAAPGLYAVKRQVRWEARQTVLPPDVFAKFANLAFWREPAGSAAYRITLRGAAPQATS
jgi:sulfotransferase